MLARAEAIPVQGRDEGPSASTERSPAGPRAEARLHNGGLPK
jgi:hypothetical protein